MLETLELLSFPLAITFLISAAETELQSNSLSDGYPISVLYNLNSLPEKALSLDMNKVMPSPSDAVVMNKVASFTSVMVTQINTSHQLPVPPNQLLLNEKVSLSPALYSGGNYSALNPQFMVTQTNSSHQLPVPPNQWLLNEKVPLSPALYSGGNYSALNPQYGYTVSISPVLNSLPEKTIRMGVSKAMPLPSDAVVASKVTSFAPLMFPQISGGQELSSPPNQIPFNGTLSPTQVLSNGSNCLTPQPQYGYPVSTLLNLNSLPEKTVGMDAGKAMPSSSTPMIMEKKRFVQDLLSREVIDLVDESVNKKDKQEIGKWKPLAQKKAERNVPRTIASYSSEHLGPSQRVSSQQQIVDRGIVQEEILIWQSPIQKQMDLCFLKPTVKSSAVPAMPSPAAFSLELMLQSPCDQVMTLQTIASLKQRSDKGDKKQEEAHKWQPPVQGPDGGLFFEVCRFTFFRTHSAILGSFIPTKAK